MGKERKDGFSTITPLLDNTSRDYLEGKIKKNKNKLIHDPSCMCILDYRNNNTRRHEIQAY